MLGSLGGIKLTILVGALSATVAASGGFFAGKRWEQANQVQLMREQMNAVNAAYAESLGKLNNAWEEEAARVQLELTGWLEQHESDQKLIADLVETQNQIRSNFDVLESLVETTNGGTCSFNAASVSMFNNASFAANHRGSDT